MLSHSRQGQPHLVHRNDAGVMMNRSESAVAAGSPRRAELLELAYAYTREHGLAGLSLRPLAAAATTSPRVLLYLFGSKDDLVREILARARREQLDLVAEVTADGDYHQLVRRLWRWLAASEQRDAVRLFFEAYALSLRAVDGPWIGFAEQSIKDWTEMLLRAQPQVPRDEAQRRATRTLALLRGLLLHLLAGGDPDELEAALSDGC